MDFEHLQAEMVEIQLCKRGITDHAVLEAMGKIPRHLFVPKEELCHAYSDCALPIGHGQTISQPYMVAKMTQCLELNKDLTVLEIGTGSGYQTAVLAEIAAHVFTIERIEILAKKAQETLKNLDYKNITFFIANGSFGVDERSPFDRIIVTAAASKVPLELVGQLKNHGKIVIPIGSKNFQILNIIEKIDDKLKIKEDDGCIFVPLVGKYGW
jgi:protein-L-isoaspartate(D-aspartate) O-methyltransferase